MKKTLILMILLFPAFLFATEPHGFVKTTTMFGLRGENKNRFIMNDVKLQINLDQDLGDYGDVSGSFDVVYEKYLDNPPELKIQPIEFYAQYSGKYFGIKAGKYYDFWGLFEWISPTDIINPWDMTHITSDIEDYRISVYGINLSTGNGIGTAPLFRRQLNYAQVEICLYSVSYNRSGKSLFVFSNLFSDMACGINV